MSVRRLLFVLLALAGLLLGAGCGGNGGTSAGDETSDPLYQQAQDLKKQGRYSEALTDFLKEIDRRGESGAPESHLEAGTLYLTWSKDPVEAYHHFSKYLELRPTGPRADMVRGQRQAALRDIARVLLAPSDDQTNQLQAKDEIAQLQRRVQELEAENQALRGGGGPVAAARAAPMIALPNDNSAGAPVAAVAPADSPITPATTPAPAGGFPVPAANPPPEVAATRRPTAPERPGNGTRPTPATPGRRTHTVAAHESLWAIARRYYGSGVNAAKVRGIYDANRDVMSSPNDLRAGMVLRIP